MINQRGNVSITKHWGAFVQPLLQWKNNEYYILLVCVCSLKYPADNSHAPYRHLWPVPLYNIFPHYLISGTIFEKRYWTQTVSFNFIYNFVWNISHSKQNWMRYDRECISVFTYSTRYSCPIVMKLEFSRVFRKILKYSNFMKIRPVWAEMFNADRQTDWQTWWSK